MADIQPVPIAPAPLAEVPEPHPALWLPIPALLLALFRLAGHHSPGRASAVSDVPSVH
jgi:hypothetical protein